MGRSVFEMSIMVCKLVELVISEASSMFFSSRPSR